jgi:hypothetical protein
MLTTDELRSANINFDIAKEALAQSEKRLSDALEAKKTVEQKATVLFGAYVTISLALFGVGGALLRDATLNVRGWPFFFAGTCFVVGAVAFVLVLRSGQYGNLGSQPSMWLQPGRIDGDQQELGRMFAYLAHHHQSRIATSYESNASKRRALHFGMAMGVVGVIVLFSATLFTFCPFATRP